MKIIKTLLLLVCVIAFAGCASNKGSSCGMSCCTDGKTDCAHCATCSAKKS